MNWPRKDYLNRKFTSLMNKSLWTIALIIITTIILIITFIFTFSIFYFISPSTYFFKTQPQFTINKQHPQQLVAFYQNNNIKNDFCMDEEYKYAGSSLSHLEFCHFQYQELPRLTYPVDLTLHNHDPSGIRYVTVCLLKRPIKVKPPERSKSPEQQENNETEGIFIKQEENTPLPKTYICQRYRATGQVKIANDLKLSDILFLQLRMELAGRQEGEQLGEVTLGLHFEEERSWLTKKIIDWYFWITIMMSSGIALTISLLTFIIGAILIIRFVDVEEEREQIDESHSQCKNQ